MAITYNQTKDFANLLVQRGLGIYGRSKMAEICFDADVGLLDDDSIDFLDDNYITVLNKFMINYAKFNLVAKMTVIALARQYNIPIPNELKKKTGRKSRFKRIFSRE